jgi:hypothetical protein
MIGSCNLILAPWGTHWASRNRARLALQIPREVYDVEVSTEEGNAAITEGDPTLCGHKTSVGSYGFG